MNNEKQKENKNRIIQKQNQSNKMWNLTNKKQVYGKFCISKKLWKPHNWKLTLPQEVEIVSVSLFIFHASSNSMDC